MNKKVGLSIIMLLTVVFIMFFNTKESLASLNCKELPEENVRYVNATLTKINREEYNAMQRGMHWTNYYNLPMEKRYEIDQKSMFMASTEGMCIGGVQNGFIGLNQYGNSLGVLQGLAKDRLVNDNIYISDQYTNKDSFFPKQNNNPEVYKEFLKDWKMPFLKQANGYYSFDSDKYHISKDFGNKILRLHEGGRAGFYPFNNCDDDTFNMKNRNLGFTVRLDIPFIMTKDGKVKNSETKQYEDMVFKFSGDDDVWVFVDDKLVLDLGGNHIKLRGNINFARNEVYYESIYNPATNKEEKDIYKKAFSNGMLSQGKHTLKIFYMERAGGESNLFVTFNLQSGGIEANYIDKATGKLLDKENQSGPVGEKVTTKAKEFTGYTLIERPKTEEYTLTENLQNVNYYYAKNSQLTVKYVDELTNREIADRTIIKGKYGDKYNTEKKEIEGYGFSRVEGSTSGTLKGENLTITYYYKKISNVTAKYVDEVTEKEIASSESIRGKVGDGYKTGKKDISGYEYVRVDGEPEGYIKTEDVIITYYYRKKSNVLAKYIDEITNKEIIQSDKFNGKNGDNYKTVQKEIPNYDFIRVEGDKEGTFGQEDKQVIYYYKYKTKVTVNYIDKDTGDIIESVKEEKYDGDTYTSQERKYEDYKLVEKPEKETVKLGKEEITLNYYYQKLKFNLKIEMNLEKALVNGNYYGLNGKIGKIETEIRDANKNSNLQVYYKIKVTNDQERSGSGYIYFTIPQGYHIIMTENSKWQIEEKMAKLKVEDLDIGETREYEIVIEKDEGIDIAGDIKANIKIESEKLQETTLSDNEDMNELVVMPRTGAKLLNLLPIILILVIFAIILYMKLYKKRK